MQKLRFLFLLLILCAAVAVCAYGAVAYSRLEENALVSRLRESQASSIDEVKKDLAVFRERAVSDTNLLAASGDARMFAVEYGQDSFSFHLADMETTLRDFRDNFGFESITLMNASLQRLASSGAVLPMEGIAKTALIDKKPVFGVPEFIGDILVIPLAMPVMASFSGPRDRVVGMVGVWIPLDRLFRDILEKRSREIKILVQAKEGFFWAAFTRDKLSFTKTENPGDLLRFGKKDAGNGEVYGQASPVPGLPFLVFCGTGADVFKGSGLPWVLAFLAVLVVGVAPFILCFMVLKRARGAVKTQLKDMKEATIRQEAVIDAVNSALGAGILAVDAKGHASHMNQAFKSLMNTDATEGTPVADFLPPELIGAMMESRGNAWAKSLEWAKGGRNFNVTILPYAEKDYSVFVFQDITDFVERLVREKEQLGGIIDGLSRAIESVEKGSAGQSEHLLHLAESAVELTAEEKTTLEMAARLSQIGKLFVPREVFAKKTLSENDRKEIAKIPDYADAALAGFKLDLSVREAVAGMYKRYDTHPELSFVARLLACANAVAAMSRKKAWRERMDIGEIMLVLSCDPKFDQEILAKILFAARNAKNDWLHRMSLKAQAGYELLEQDKEAMEALNKGIRSLK